MNVKKFHFSGLIWIKIWVSKWLNLLLFRINEIGSEPNNGKPFLNLILRFANRCVVLYQFWVKKNKMGTTTMTLISGEFDVV